MARLAPWLVILVSVGCFASKPAAESSVKEQIRLAKEQGAEEARKDLAAGTPKQYRTSGYVGPTYRYNWDPETGLRIVDTGCFLSAAYDEYNRVVKEWIARHGVPSASMKPRFVTQELARKWLQSGSSLSPGHQVTGSKSKMIRWKEMPVRDLGHLDLVVAETNGKEIWSHWIKGTEPIRVAWTDQSWFLELPPGRADDKGLIWHVDADGNGVLQTFDLTTK